MASVALSAADSSSTTAATSSISKSTTTVATATAKPAVQDWSRLVDAIVGAGTALIHTHKTGIFSSVKKCMSATELLDWLEHNRPVPGIASRADALALCRSMIREGVMRCASTTSTSQTRDEAAAAFADTTGAAQLYRLTALERTECACGVAKQWTK